MSNTTQLPNQQPRRQYSNHNNQLTASRQTVFLSPPIRPLSQPQHIYSPTTFFDPNSQQYIQSTPQPVYFDPNADSNTMNSPYVGPFYYIMPTQASEYAQSSSSSSQTAPSPSMSIPSAANSTPNFPGAAPGMSPFAFYSPERPPKFMNVENVPSLMMPAPANPTMPLNRPLVSPHMSPVISPMISPQPSPGISPAFIIPMPPNMMPPRSPMRNLGPPAMLIGQVVNAPGGTIANTNVYVRGLESTMTDDKFFEIVKNYGNILSAKAIVHLQTGECKGFGFVMYERESEARAAMHGLEAQGYQVSLARVGPRLDGDNYNVRMPDFQDPRSTNVYISNLPLEYNETNLIELLKPQVVLSAKVLRETNGKSRGVGFARLDTREAALAVITRFNEQEIPGTDIALQVRFADSEAQKRLKALQSKTRKMGTPAISVHGVLAAPLSVPYGTTAYPVYTASPISSGIVTPVAFAPIDPSSMPLSIMMDGSQAQLVEDMAHLDVTDDEEVDYGTAHDEGYYQNNSASGVVASLTGGVSIGVTGSNCGESNDSSVGQPLRPADLLAAAQQ